MNSGGRMGSMSIDPACKFFCPPFPQPCKSCDFRDPNSCGNSEVCADGCVAPGSSRQAACVECNQDLDCGDSAQVCNRRTRRCTLPCGPGLPPCQQGLACVERRCVDCTDDSECPAGFCRDTRCVECLGDGDCFSGRCDEPRGACLECDEQFTCFNSTCNQGMCNCISDAECVGPQFGVPQISMFGARCLDAPGGNRNCSCLGQEDCIPGMLCVNKRCLLVH